MDTADLIYLRGFGLGKSERAPWRKDDYDADRWWDLRTNVPLERGGSENGKSIGFVKVYSPQDVFALYWLNGEVKLAGRSGQQSFTVPLLTDKNAVARVHATRGLGEGTASVTTGDGKVFSFSYPLFRLAELLADGMVIENLDFFRYIEREQQRSFAEFLGLFS